MLESCRCSTSPTGIGTLSLVPRYSDRPLACRVHCFAVDVSPWYSAPHTYGEVWYSTCGCSLQASILRSEIRGHVERVVQKKNHLGYVDLSREPQRNVVRVNLRTWGLYRPCSSPLLGQSSFAAETPRLDGESPRDRGCHAVNACFLSYREPRPSLASVTGTKRDERPATCRSFIEPRKRYHEVHLAQIPTWSG